MSLFGIYVKGCTSLEDYLFGIYVKDCISLENKSSLNQQLFVLESLHHEFNLSDCFKLDKNKRDPISELRDCNFVDQLEDNQNGLPTVHICHLGGRIPERFVHQSKGDSIRILLPSD